MQQLKKPPPRTFRQVPRSTGFSAALAAVLLSPVFVGMILCSALGDRFCIWCLRAGRMAARLGQGKGGPEA
ncbi:hypothetical protein [Albidovulum sediminis]|uniref:Uncharacterized protein n=1 Tax=Albidovulum sediminis TaxID=3066345 RepID=A0ABT2NH33_9RHOB|nr:hypothetical protein [Defluviimonas sediminis]MCT8328065.1 hypothetical protein [Defluviimonas sediminis]